MELTLNDVKARSSRDVPGIGTLWCWDCDLNFAAVEMPCLKHCNSDEERAERDRRFSDKLIGRDWRMWSPYPEAP